MSKTIDMTHGPLGKKIFTFALPLAFTGILQQLFNAADVAVVGQFANKYAMAAVGSNSSIINLLVSLFMGISLGANIVIARFTGQGDTEKIQRGVRTAIALALISGLLVTAVGECVAGPILRAMGVPASVFPMAEAYLRIYLAGMPVIMLYNFESAIFRSQGNTRTPLICLAIAGVLNVFLNLFFVIVLHMDADGVAIATVISNLVSSAIMFVLLCREKGVLHLDIRKIRIDRRVVGGMLRVGLPSGLQGMLFSLSNIVIQSAVNSLGADVMAASSAAFNLEIMVYYLVNAFGQANTTFVSQNYGAGKMDRCRKTVRISLLQDMGIVLIVSALFLVLAPQLIHFFNSDPAVIHYGAIRLRWIAGSEVVNVFLEGISGAMRGYGHSLTPALIILIGVCGFRILYVYTFFRTHHTFNYLMMVYPMSWAVSDIGLVAAYFLMLRKLREDDTPPTLQTAE